MWTNCQVLEKKIFDVKFYIFEKPWIKTSMNNILEIRRCAMITKPVFLIPISLQPDGVNLWCFKLLQFDLIHFLAWNIKGLRHQVTIIYELEKTGFVIMIMYSDLCTIANLLSFLFLHQRIIKNKNICVTKPWI